MNSDHINLNLPANSHEVHKKGHKLGTLIIQIDLRIRLKKSGIYRYVTSY